MPSCTILEFGISLEVVKTEVVTIKEIPVVQLEVTSMIQNESAELLVDAAITGWQKNITYHKAFFLWKTLFQTVRIFSFLS